MASGDFAVVSVGLVACAPTALDEITIADRAAMSLLAKCRMRGIGLCLIAAT